MPLRRVVESEDFERDRSRLASSHRAFDEILFAVTWALARSPESGIPLEPPVWAFPTYPLQGAPGFVFFYRFDEREVVLEGLELEDWQGE